MEDNNVSLGSRSQSLFTVCCLISLVFFFQAVESYTVSAYYRLMCLPEDSNGNLWGTVFEQFLDPSWLRRLSGGNH